LCGITGFAGIKSDPSIISSMLGSIKHRGPNDDGYSLYENLAIGMTRLSIVDIHGGAQPMHTNDGRFSIVFNGEIYNYQELAKEYRAAGGILKTHSDTEVVLALYETWREKCLEKLRGMFAFAVLDRQEKSIFIVRDRIGIKPLYFWHKDSILVFGSEIKSMLASELFRAEANFESIVDYLSFRYVPGPMSLFKDVQRLAPGHWMRWQDGDIKQQCYWRPTIREKSTLSDAILQEQFNSLLEETVAMHRMGDVPHGAYLSGGLDSAAIVSSLTKQSTSPVKTFTVGFDWEGDELLAARETAQLLGSEHHEIICTAKDFEVLPQIIWHSDEPLGDPIALPTYILAKEASKHVKIVLTGEGADEILAGYLFHQAVTMAHHYHQWVPDVIHRMMIKPAINCVPVGLLNKGFNYPGYLGDSGKQRLLSFLDLARKNNSNDLLTFFITLFDDKEKNNLLNKSFAYSIINNKKTNQSVSTETGLERLLMMQYANWLPDNILMRQDKMSMAHGLEARVPFLDHQLVEFMETVPRHLKLTLRKNKVLLRNYTATQGATHVAKRKKKAFYFPMEAYFNSQPFQDLLSSTLGEKQVQNRGLFRYEAISRLIKNMQHKDFLAYKQIFSLISLELWFQIFIDKQFTFNE